MKTSTLSGIKVLSYKKYGTILKCQYNLRPVNIKYFHANSNMLLTLVSSVGTMIYGETERVSPFGLFFEAEKVSENVFEAEYRHGRSCNVLWVWKAYRYLSHRDQRTLHDLPCLYSASKTFSLTFSLILTSHILCV